MSQEGSDGLSKRVLTEEDQPVEAFLLEGPVESLEVGVGVSHGMRPIRPLR